MMGRNLSTSCKLTRHLVAQVAGTDDTLTPSVSIDMQGFEHCLFLVSLGTITATAVTTIAVHQSSVVDGSGDAFTAIAGTAVSIAADDDDQIAYIDINKPRERFLKLIITRATANAVIDGVIALQYGADSRPTTHGATVVSTSELHVDKAEGSQ